MRAVEMMYTDPNNPVLPKQQEALLQLLCEFDRVCQMLEIPYVLFAGTLLGAVRHRGFIPWDDDVDVLMLREDYERFLREADALINRERFFLQKEFSDHWPMFFSKLRMNDTTCLEKFHPKDSRMHQGLYMDIFPCDRAFSGKFGRKVQFLASKVVIAKSLFARGYDTDSLKKKLFMGFCRCLPTAPFLWIVQKGSVRSGIRHSFLGAASSYEKNVFPETYFQSIGKAFFEGKEYPVPAQYDALLRQLYGDYMKIPPPEDRMVKQHAILVDLENSYEMYSHYRDDMRFDVHTRSIR